MNVNEMTALERLPSSEIKFVYAFYNVLMYVFDVCKQSCSMFDVIDEPLKACDTVVMCLKYAGYNISMACM